MSENARGEKSRADPPLVSVVIPCFNAARYVEAAVCSVLEQNYPNLEIVAVDDGSTDGTAAVLDALEQPVRVVRFPRNRGAAAARNAGFAAARGRFAVALDADDSLRPGAVAALVSAALAHPDARFVIPHVDMVDASGALLRAYPPESQPLDLHAALAMRIPLTAGILIRDPSAAPPVRYDELFGSDSGRSRLRPSRAWRRRRRRPFTLEDWILWIDVAAQDMTAIPAPEARSLYIRQNPASQTADIATRWRDGLSALEHGRRVGLRVHGDCAECRAALARGRRSLADWCLSRDWSLIFDPARPLPARVGAFARVIGRGDRYSTFIVARTCAWRARDAAAARLARRRA